MKLTLLNSSRLIMFILISYIYYSSLQEANILHTVYVCTSILIFIINHVLMLSIKQPKYSPIFIAIDSICITGFIFLFPGSTLYLILFGVNAVTLFLAIDKISVIISFVTTFFIVWAVGVGYTYHVTGVVDLMSNIVNFTFITFASIVGSLIRKLINAQEQIAVQYTELNDSHKALKDAHLQLQFYTEQVTDLTMIQERNRISREIHDTVGHKMTALLIQLQLAKELQETDLNKSKTTIELCEELSRSALQEIRLAVRTLQLDKKNENRSIVPNITKILEEYQRMTGLQADFHFKGEPNLIPPSTQIQITRILQESITNAVRHGKATICKVSVDVSETNIVMSVKDNGKGVNTINPGFGLNNMRQRVHELGGSLTFESSKEYGFYVHASFPLKEIYWKAGESL
ncbi:sensor histidine kinase [Aquibacillus kalidii]|uniref:sensor histidine kinase n=1 Tax=Aquibacillus kalidii TaxID=2762597 RepID=UPI0016442928|nr:sensor histidine kinase [Aquibacillus kalidii]